MPTTDRKLRVFLCHASQDKPVVRELYQRLAAEGWIDPWLDEEKLLPGQDWDMEIEKAVEAADAVIVCLSKNSLTKEGYVQKELKFVLDIALEKPEGAIFIIPIRLDDCEIPRKIHSWQYVDYFPVSRTAVVFQKLLSSLNIRANTLGVNAEVKKVASKIELPTDPREKEVKFFLETEPKVFVDWFYQTYFHKGLSSDKSVKLPNKASPYLYKPLGFYSDDDPINFRLETDRNIDGKSYKGTIVVEIEILSISPIPRISVKMKYIEDEFFLVFYRTLVGIAKMYKEAQSSIMPYLNKYRSVHDSIQ
jgi:hypothetical protein